MINYKIACLNIWYCSNENLADAVHELKKEYNIKRVVFGEETTKQGKILFVFPHNKKEYKLYLNIIRII